MKPNGGPLKTLGRIGKALLPLGKIRTVYDALSTLAFVVAVLGLALLLASVLLRLLLPDLKGEATTLMYTGAILFLIYILGAFNRIVHAVTGRRGRYGVNTILMIAAFLAIVIIGNYLGRQSYRRFDLTASAQFSLSRQTNKILSNMNAPVKAHIFYSPGDPIMDIIRGKAANTLREYAFKTKKFSYDNIDMDRERAQAVQYEVAESGTIVFESGDRRQKLEPRYDESGTPAFFTEQDFTTAILVVTGTKQKSIYFLTGHGERDIDSGAASGYVLARQGIEGDNYLVKPLLLASAAAGQSTQEQTASQSTDTSKQQASVPAGGKAAVPADATVVVLASPKKPLLPDERVALTDYLNDGGKLLALVDPNTPPDVVDMLGKWGIKVENGLVMDPLNAGGDVTGPVISAFAPGVPITSQIQAVYFPEAVSLSQADKVPETGQVYPLLASSADSWLKQGDTSDKKFNEATDKKGPLFLGTAMMAISPKSIEAAKANQTEATPKITRIVAYGDSDFAANDLFYTLSNGDLFLNTLNWLAEDEELISIRPKPLEYRQLVVSKQQKNLIFYSSLVMLPLLVALAGGVAWWRHR
ncbi:MAG: GldG family protein [Chloroflexi bacterium]|nr:GldG family protein [Chloroflexota bacterium]